jgi:hypothetical protein
VSAASPERDALSTALSEVALEALETRIQAVVEQQLRDLLPAAIERACLTPWLDTAAAAAYLGVTSNALRLRERAGLVKAYRDPAGRLRFHRDALDRSMIPEPQKRPRRGPR